MRQTGRRRSRYAVSGRAAAHITLRLVVEHYRRSARDQKTITEKRPAVDAAKQHVDAEATGIERKFGVVIAATDEGSSRVPAVMLPSKPIAPPQPWVTLAMTLSSAPWSRRPPNALAQIALPF